MPTKMPSSTKTRAKPVASSDIGSAPFSLGISGNHTVIMESVRAFQIPRKLHLPANRTNNRRCFDGRDRQLPGSLPFEAKENPPEILVWRPRFRSGLPNHRMMMVSERCHLRLLDAGWFPLQELAQCLIDRLRTIRAPKFRITGHCRRPARTFSGTRQVQH